MTTTAEDKERLYNMYNATSTADPEGSDELETYENWLERQLLSRLKKIEELEKELSESFKEEKRLAGCVEHWQRRAQELDPIYKDPRYSREGIDNHKLSEHSTKEPVAWMVECNGRKTAFFGKVKMLKYIERKGVDKCLITPLVKK